MKKMKWLLRREMWEHKGMLFRAPLAVSLLLLVVSAFTYYCRDAFTSQGIARPFAEMSEQNLINQANELLGFYAHVFLLFGGMLTVLIFFYCLQTLYEDRKDRSIYFWKSLPVSDVMTVGSKLILVMLIAPVIMILSSAMTSIIMMLFVVLNYAFKGLNLFGLMLSEPGLYLIPLRALALLPLYFLWALPTIGWLLMISSWVRGKAFLWAVGAPMILLWLLHMVNLAMGLALDMKWFSLHLVGRLLLSVVPGLWLRFENVNVQQISEGHDLNASFAKFFAISWESLGSLELWLGVIAGMAMIGVAVRMRRWRSDV